MTLRRALVLGAVGLVVAAIAAAFFVVGSPAEQRLLRLDERRIQDLGRIRSAVDGYWRNNKQLPDSLEQAGEAAALFRDPVSGSPYEYRVGGERSYELCATFDRPFTPEVPDEAIWLWPHPAGKHCFQLTTNN